MVNPIDDTRWCVAIPVYNAIAVTRRAVEYLIDSGVEAARIKLYDDGSPDPAWQALKIWAETAGCQYNRFDENVGYTVNINRAFEGDEEFVLLLNSDCLIRRSAIDALLETAQRFPMLAGVGPLSNHAGSQSIALIARRMWQDLDNTEIAASVDHVETRLAWRYGRRPFVVPSVNGFCTLWRREAVQSVGLYDAENFRRGYGEEDDLCFRLMDAGWFCAVAPWVFAVHFKTQSFTAVERNARKPVAMQALERIHGARFMNSVVTHFEAHPMFRQLATEPIDA